MALVSGATYVARAFSSERKQLTELMLNGCSTKDLLLLMSSVLYNVEG